jgi:hypothetical protein
MAAGLALLALFILPAPLQAQQPPRPVVEQARILVTMADGGDDTVEATYTVQNTAGLQDRVVEHILVRRPGAEVGDVEASGATAGTPTVERREGLTRVKVPVNADPATYTLRYTVRRAPGTYAVPIVAPNVPVARSEPNVTIETTLPPGQNQEGEWFPSIDRTETRDGRTVLVHRVINVPSVTIAEYGRGSPFNLSLLITVVGFGLLAIILVGWFRHALVRQPAAGLSH